MKKAMSMVINDKVSIKNQLRMSYCFMVVFSVIVTFAICFGLIFSLASSSYITARDKIDTQTRESVSAVAVEISNSIGQQLKIIAESICMTTVLYSSVLIQYSNVSSVQGTLLTPLPSFRDYHFVPDCTYPDCPDDISNYGLARLPPNFNNASLTHSSVYLYSGKFQQAVRNDSMWDDVVAESPQVVKVMNGLVYQDIDFHSMYTEGVNMSSMYFLTAEVQNHHTGYADVVHRTFPGMRLNESAYGNPAQNEWFLNAPVNAVFLDGPLQEPFTKQQVVVLSSRKVAKCTLAGQEQNINFVASAVVLLDSLALSVSRVDYNNEGFGAVMKLSSLEMLVWRDSAHSVMNLQTGQFHTLWFFDALLAAEINAIDPESQSERQIVKYTDAQGEEWLVSYVPFFTTESFNNDDAYPALVMLLFSKTSEANAPLIHLSDQIDDTSLSIVVIVIIIAACTIFLVFSLVVGTVQYITQPLPGLMRVSEEIIFMSTVDEGQRDYTALVNNELFVKLTRTDELGLLIADFYQLLTVLQARNVTNRDTSQYPQNPFYLLPDDYSGGSKTREDSQTTPECSWRWLMERMTAKLTDDQRAALNEATAPKTSKRIVPAKVVGKTAAAAAASLAASELDSTVNSAPQPKPAPPSIKSSTDTNSYRRGKKIAIEGEHTFDAIPEEPAQDLESNGRSHSEDVIKLKQDAAAVVAANSATKTAENKFDTSKSIATSKTEANKSVTYLSSLKTQLNSLLGTLLTGLVVCMIVTVVMLRAQGRTWSDLTKKDLRGKVVENLQAIAYAKSTYVETYFQQLSLDLVTSSRYFAEMVSGNLTREGWFESGHEDLYLPSYSLDRFNTYYKGSLQGSTNSSGYYLNAAGQCERTKTCNITQNSFNTRMTSLMELKFKSLYRAGNSLSFVQYGLEEDGTMRYLPFTRLLNVSYPSTCYFQETSPQLCADKYWTSSCNTSWVNPDGSGKKKFPIYEARCRSWYQLSVRYSTRENVYYQTPRASDAGVYVLTGGIAVKQNSDPTSKLLGVINSNFLITTLSRSIAQLNYLSEGYCYLVAAANTSVLIVHPKADSRCKFVQCAEGFSYEEYEVFLANVLVPIQYRDQNVSTVYMKGGRQWELVYAYAQFGFINYVLISTVPVDVVLQTSEAIQSSVNNTIVGMVIAFVFSIVFLVAISALYAYELVRSIVEPINELRKVFELVRMNEDLSGQVPEEASSSDMRVLLTAFSKLMVALRFSSESYAQGNQKRAREVYTDALDLYTGNNDKRGIGISLTNLAAAEFARKRYEAAETLYKKAIEMGEDVLKERMDSRTEVNKAERMLSDRKGDLGAVYLEDNRYDTAMELLSPAMERDVQKSYLIGYALKQGSIGKYFLMHGEFVGAEKIFYDLLEFAQQYNSTSTPMKASPAGNVRILNEEKESAIQIALFKIGMLRAARQDDTQVVEAAYVESLVRSSVMYSATTIKALIALKALFLASHRTLEVQQLDFLAAEFNLNVSRDTSVGAFGRNVNSADMLPKRVMFCLDYSASMAGVKLQATMDNVNTMFELHVNDKDSMSILFFNHKVRFALPITPKKDNELLILDNMEKINAPKGTAALYDAIAVSLYALSLEPTSQDWLIVVTSCEDSASRLSLQVVLDKVMFSKVGLIIIGIGKDIQTAALELLATSTKRGVYFHAQADKKSINEVFEHALHIINTSSVAANTQ